MKLEIGGKAYEVDVAETGQGMFRVTVDGAVYEVKMPLDRGQAAGRRPGRIQEHVQAASRTSGPAPAAAASGDGHVVSPLPGVVAQILVGSGDGVKSGQPLVMLESMKMNVPVTAHGDGTVGRILVSVGDSVQVGQKILELG